MPGPVLASLDDQLFFTCLPIAAAAAAAIVCLQACSVCLSVQCILCLIVRSVCKCLSPQLTLSACNVATDSLCVASWTSGDRCNFCVWLLARDNI